MLICFVQKKVGLRCVTIYGVRLIPLPAAAGRGRGEMGQGKVPIVVACAGVCGCVWFWLRGGGVGYFFLLVGWGVGSIVFIKVVVDGGGLVQDDLCVLLVVCLLHSLLWGVLRVRQ